MIASTPDFFLKIDGSHDFQGDAVVVVGLVAEGKKDLSRCFSRFSKVAVVKQLVAVDALRLKCRDRVREGVLALLELRDVDRVGRGLVYTHLTRLVAWL